MSAYDDMTAGELRDAIAAMQAELERRGTEASDREAVETAVAAYAGSQGLTVLEAWRALVPEGVEVPDDPEPPDAPDYVKPTGAHDAYNTGDLVTFQGKVYRARLDAVVWSPLEYPQAWEAI